MQGLAFSHVFLILFLRDALFCRAAAQYLQALRKLVCVHCVGILDFVIPEKLLPVGVGLYQQPLKLRKLVCAARLLCRLFRGCGFCVRIHPFKTRGCRVVIMLESNFKPCDFAAVFVNFHTCDDKFAVNLFAAPLVLAGSEFVGVYPNERCSI